MTKKIIFIDWNRTLSYSLFWEHLNDTAHPNNKHLEAIVQWLFVNNKEMIDLWMRGTITVEEVIECMSKETLIDPTLIQSELELSCKNMSLCSTDLEGLIQDLRSKGSIVAIATDNMDTFRKYTVPSLKLNELFDDILISSELGILKDDKDPANSIKFFDDYLSQKGLGYADAVLLDDSPDSSGKYARLGFERVLIDSPAKLLSTLNDMSSCNVS